MRSTLRNHLVYEQVTGIPFSPSKVLNVLTFMFCVLLANNDSFSMKFDEFIEAIDEDETIMHSFTAWLSDEANRQGIFIEQEQPTDGGKKKESP